MYAPSTSRVQDVLQLLAYLQLSLDRTTHSLLQVSGCGRCWHTVIDGPREAFDGVALIAFA